MPVPDGQRCYNCRFADTPNDDDDMTDDDNAVALELWCLREPPVNSAEWPRVNTMHWCGEWQPAKPDTLDEAALAMARAVVLGDYSAARPLADRLIELDTERVRS